MDVTEVIKVIKRKLFEPHKKISFNSEGEKFYESSKSWAEDRKKLTNIDKDLLDEIDGWNLADKDYVDFKIKEQLYSVNHLGNFATLTHEVGNKNAPSAPIKMESRFFSFNSPNSTNDIMEFFVPGIILKKNWIISEFMLFTELPFEKDTVLSIKNVVNNTEAKLATINASNNKTFTAEPNYKLEETSVIILSIKLFKPSNSKMSFHLTVLT